jgi:Family of unknown function (DUF6641)
METAMTAYLKTLTLTNAPRRGDTVVQRREKLVARINDQIALARDASYVPTQRKRVAGEDGQKRTVEVPRNISPWWANRADGGATLIVRYANRHVELAPGKICVAVPKGELVKTLETLAAAVSAGELDDQIAKVAPTGVGKKAQRGRKAA